MSARTGRRMVHGVRTTACVLAGALALLAATGASARADGDPGSDVLVYQPLFLASDAGVPVADQVRLGTLLQTAKRSGFEIRVAIISRPSDLGAITELWGHPRSYARFLDLELVSAYPGRLLVVMPSGVGFSWPGHSSANAYRALAPIRVGPGAGGLVDATQAAVTSLTAAAHVRVSAAPPAAPPGAGPSRSPHVAAAPVGSTRLLAFVGLAALALAIIAIRIVAARYRTTLSRRIERARQRLGRRLSPARRARRRPAATRPGTLPRRPRHPAVLLGAAVLLLGAALALAVAVRHRSATPSEALASNPLLDPGTPLSRPAPDFTLNDQFGAPISLPSFRGKVVILAFNDSECTSVCPLTTTAMLDAKAMLGAAGDRVQLLGVDANPKATSIDDVQSYSELHGMLHAWHFLTGSLPALQRVWKAYSIGVGISQRSVDHTPAVFVIDPHGRLRRLYLTQQSYASVGQLGQELATEASSLLPATPPVRSHRAYSQIPGTSPAQAATIPRIGGGRVHLGPGQARLLLFFATWDRQITGLSAGMARLSRYQALAARAGLPSLVAVDEGSVEPPGALKLLLADLPGRDYPVAIDTDGRLADGYEVLGQPWLVLVTSTGKIAWYDSIAGSGWLTTRYLVRQVTAALARMPATTQSPSRALAGSPAPLAHLHSQASQLLGAGSSLAARLHALRGYPIVVNVWASWCAPCRSEFSLFASAALRYSRRVAFLGANTDDSAGDARAFLAEHNVTYPSYQSTRSDLASLAVVEGLPTTIYLDRHGRVINVHTGQYDTQGSLDADIATYAGPR